MIYYQEFTADYFQFNKTLCKGYSYGYINKIGVLGYFDVFMGLYPPPINQSSCYSYQSDQMSWYEYR